MDKLLAPDWGLSLWTIVTFVLLLAILKKAAWGPLVKALEEREKKIRDDVEFARLEREEVQKERQALQAEIASLKAKARSVLDEAARDGESLRQELKAKAEAEAARVRERASMELEADREKMLRVLRKDVGTLAVSAAERLLGRTVDPEVQSEVLGSFLKELESENGRPIR